MEENNSTASVSLRKNYVFNLILTVANFLFPLITYPYVSRILQPEGMGVVGFANSVVSYFILVAELGIPMYGIRVCSNLRNDKKELSKATKELLLIGLITALVVFSALIASIFLINKFNQEKILYFVLSVSLLLGAIGMEWLFKGLEKYDYITKRSLLFKCISVVAIFILIHEQSDYIIYAGISVFSSSASFICNFLNSRKYIDYKTKEKLELKKHIKGIMAFFAMSCASAIYLNLDTVMLGFMCGDEVVGFYNAAVKIRVMLLAVITALGAVVLPRASYFVKQNQMDEFWRIIKKAFSLVLLLAFPLTLYFCIFAEPSILLLSGELFLNSVLPMQLIMPTLIFIGISNITGIQILIPLGKEKVVVLSEIVGAVVDFALNMILIPQYGAAGAAFSTLIAEILVLIVQLIFLRKDLLTLFSNFNYLDLVIGCVLAVGSSFWVYFFDFNCFVYLIISGPLFFLVFYGYMFLRKQPVLMELFDILRDKLRFLKKKKKEE